MVNRANIWVRKGRMATSVVAALACGLIALAVLPAFASAAPFTVDSTGDAPKTATGAVCETETGECTLRAAIEAANTTNLPDEILFDPGVFDGAAPASTITLGSPLPAIVHGVEIDAGRCPTPYGVEGPCAEVAGLPASPIAPNVFTVSGDEVTIRDLAIEGGLNGILDAEHGGAFTAVGDWFGIELNGGPDGGSFKSGVFVEEDDAIIGGDYEEDRNVFGFSQVGVDVQGSSHTSIQGNYIGVEPDGRGPASLEIGVRIVDVEGSPSKAADDEVGGVLTAGQAASPECDGPCNVIVTEGGRGIDLAGEFFEPDEPPTGPTQISGNYIGLSAAGTTPVGDNEFGVLATSAGGCTPGPADVTVGGTAPLETNHIVGGTIGIYTESAENFEASGNAIGIAGDGSESVSPAAVGIHVCSREVTEGAHVVANEMMLGPSTTGIESTFGLAQITDNSIEGGEAGIVTLEESEGAGDLIQGNTLTEPDLYGIQITNQSNVLVGNRITNSGGAGIEVEGIAREQADHNRIGGDLPGEENVIDGSGQGAILIAAAEAERNEVAANHGSGNQEAFIQLLAENQGDLVNGGIQPPTFATSLQSSATGNAQPNATVRIFSKASSEAGELGGLIAKVEADAQGSWQASYATLPVGTLVAATQTSDAGSLQGATSEVSEPSAATADPVKPVEPEEHEAGLGGGGSSQSGSSTPSPVPTLPTPPKAKITKHPAKSSKSTTAQFKFSAPPAAGAKFQCKLDAAKWAGCKSPRTYKKLKPRRHTFQVRAVASGRTGPPVKFQFTVKP
ncbi:MAG TPA: NosD domain-containing protein [Solirubrobacterales bacterium]|nr:NosD domain-containing protein [Solirubrobacterales bacterium]